MNAVRKRITALRKKKKEPVKLINTSTSVTGRYDRKIIIPLLM
jgi:hypothetical protein